MGAFRSRMGTTSINPPFASTYAVFIESKHLAGLGASGALARFQDLLSLDASRRNNLLAENGFHSAEARQSLRVFPVLCI